MLLGLWMVVFLMFKFRYGAFNLWAFVCWDAEKGRRNRSETAVVTSLVHGFSLGPSQNLLLQKIWVCVSLPRSEGSFLLQVGLGLPK